MSNHVSTDDRLAVNCNSYYNFFFLSVQCYAMHGQNINLPVSVCPSYFLSTRLQVRPLNGFLQLIA